MGSIIRTAANNVGASGVFSSSAFNNASLNSVTSLPTAVDGKMKLISSQTASGDASLSFTSGIDSTYKTYCFKFINLHTSFDHSYFSFNGSTDSGSNYNTTKTTTVFIGYHLESDANGDVVYQASQHLAQSTSYQRITEGMGTVNDESASGELYLFNPSSTTYVKHFMARTNTNTHHDFSIDFYTAGYLNTTSAVNAIRFQMSSGNIDDGTIYLYGLK